MVISWAVWLVICTKTVLQFSLFSISIEGEISIPGGTWASTSGSNRTGVCLSTKLMLQRHANLLVSPLWITASLLDSLTVLVLVSMDELIKFTKDSKTLGDF